MAHTHTHTHTHAHAHTHMHTHTLLAFSLPSDDANGIFRHTALDIMTRGQSPGATETNMFGKGSLPAEGSAAQAFKDENRLITALLLSMVH